MPHLSDKQVAHLSDSTVAMTKSLRKILEKNTKKTAAQIILKTWFTNIKLEADEKKGLLVYIREYYLPKKD